MVITSEAIRGAKSAIKVTLQTILDNPQWNRKDIVSHLILVLDEFDESMQIAIAIAEKRDRDGHTKQ